MYVELLDNAAGSLLTLEKVEKETNNAGWPNAPHPPRGPNVAERIATPAKQKAEKRDVKMFLVFMQEAG